jgi:4-amino-4-deoxy-L-arabinose transferase-like glycosyltransferase
MRPPRSIWPIAVVTVSALLQALILHQGWTRNPLSGAPLADAQVYWDWAGRIADGELVGATPFLSAPLYPYLLGALRALGLGLLGVYVVQAIIHLVTVLLVTDAGRRRFDDVTGVIAGALYLLLCEPAYYTGRVLNCSFQLLTVAWVLWQATSLHEKRTPTRTVGLGLALGFAVLVNPAMLIGVIILTAWTTFGSRERDLRGGVLILVVVSALIAPATWHNRRVSGETILVSAQAGLTFSHGNAPGARGTYNAIPGVSTNRLQQNIDAYRLAAEATGEEGWSATNRHFFGQGLSYLAAHPGEAVKLELRKSWWLLSGRIYSDLYTPWFEARENFGSRLHWVPLTLAGLLPVALLGAGLLVVDDWRRSLPELVLFVVPAIVVLVFWYSPRYRLPIAPPTALLTAYVLVRATKSLAAQPRRMALTFATSALLLVGPAGAWINRSSGFEDPRSLKPAFLHTVGDALRIQAKAAEALPYLEAAVNGGFDTAASRYSLFQARAMRAETLMSMGDAESRTEAIQLYVAAADSLRASLRHDPDQLEVHQNLAALELWFWRQGLRPEEAARSEIAAALALAERTGNPAAADRLRGMLAVLSAP